ncbi:hypothetical protein RJ639_034193 [Escallonia herrerae]|uniref:Ycf20 n=1 Tax=Escallonia herrerae TaxID=1293975 RepID=A0AA89BJ97_9ASTE|nr:hypothetical protein RJ639_034193 [Escallonia herrerae]
MRVSLWHSRRGLRSIRCSVSGSGSTPSSTNSTRSGTRLTRTILAFQIKLFARIKELKRDFPVKLLFFLVGFYCATAFATVIGQTGDWDILSAALAVTVVEAIGALMYGASLSELKKVKDLITMFNYWKAGVSLGLFLDSFKVVPNVNEASSWLGLFTCKDTYLKSAAAFCHHYESKYHSSIQEKGHLVMLCLKRLELTCDHLEGMTASLNKSN